MYQSILNRRPAAPSPPRWGGVGGEEPNPRGVGKAARMGHPSSRCASSTTPSASSRRHSSSP